MAGACSLIAALGAISALAAVATSVAVDKDWVALMVKGDANFLASKLKSYEINIY